VRHKGGPIVAVCRCEPSQCADIPLTGADIAVLELNWPKLGRAIAQTFGLTRREAEAAVPHAIQIAAYGYDALPVILSIQHDRDAFRQAGGEIVAYESYAKDDVDFSALLTKVKAQNPDLIFIPDYYNKVGLVAKQARQMGITAQLLGGDGWDSPEMTKIAGDAIEGGVFTNHYSPQDPRPEVQTWVAKYEAKYGGKPDALATLAYDATLLMLEAIRRAGVDDPVKVRDALAAIRDFKSVSGSITFDANGNPVKAVAVLQYHNGEQTFMNSIAP